MRLFKLLISAVIALCCVEGARILGVYPMAWGSHYILGEKLMKGLAQAGHEVTMMTPFPTRNISKHWKWTDVVLDGLNEQFRALVADQNLLNAYKKTRFEELKNYQSWFVGISNNTIHHPNTKKLIESGAVFDAVILDVFLNDCHHVFGHVFNGHLILASALGPNVMLNNKVGNYMPISTIPIALEFKPDRSRDMTFLERFWNLYYALVQYIFRHYYMSILHDQIIREAFPDAPSFHDLYYNVSLVLLNSHSSLLVPEPLVPNMIEVAGYHIDPPKKLPEDLQEFLDGAKDGAIYFSLGSILKSKDMVPEKKRMFLNVFRGLKQKILWKFEDELDGKPDNVLIKNWMPQQDILAHPNIKLFITHGGLLSSAEAIYHGIPVLSIPFFGDQQMNAHKAVAGGYGLRLLYLDENFSEELIKTHIEELLNNPKYTENAKRLSKIYHDRPMTPMQTAVYWVEYVIRHNGAPHLRVAGAKLPWYKFFMIDVLAVLFGIILAILFSICCLMKLLTGARSKNKVKKS